MMRGRHRPFLVLVLSLVLVLCLLSVVTGTRIKHRRRTIKFEDKTLTQQEREGIADYIALVDITTKAASLSETELRTSMIWELIIRPIITIMKNMITQAGEHLLAQFMVKSLLEILAPIISQSAGMPPIPEIPSTLKPPVAPADAKKDTISNIVPKNPFSFLETSSSYSFDPTHNPAAAQAWATNAEHHKNYVQAKARVPAYDYGREEAITHLHRMLKQGNKATAEDFGRFREKLTSVMQHRNTMIFDPLVKQIVPKLTASMSQAVSAQAQGLLEKTLSIRLVNRLKVEVNATVIRDVTRRITVESTAELARDLTIVLTKSLTKSLTERATQQITRSMLPTLSYSLGLTIAKAITRNPTADYYCYFCKAQNLYCDDCRSSMLNDYYLDVYTSFYAKYYERYYSYYYGDYYAKIFTNEMAPSSLSFWTGTQEKVSDVNPCLDPEDDQCINVNLVPEQQALDQGAGIPKN